MRGPSASKSSVPPHACASLAQSPCAAACSSQPVSQVASLPVLAPWHSGQRAVQALHDHHVPNARHVTQPIGLQAGHCKDKVPECWNALVKAQACASQAGAHHSAADPAQWLHTYTAASQPAGGCALNSLRQPRRSHTLPGGQPSCQQGSWQGTGRQQARRLTPALEVLQQADVQGPCRPWAAGKAAGSQPACSSTDG